VTAGVPTTQLDTVIPAANPSHLRVARVGGDWSVYYSGDGQHWTAEAPFTHALVVAAVGVYAFNDESVPGTAPAHTAAVDYFFDFYTPIWPEDGIPTGDPGPKVLNVTTNSLGSVVRVPDQPTYTCGEVVELTAVPDPGQEFAGWAGDASGTANPLSIVMSWDRSVHASFASDITAPVLSEILATAGTVSATVTWTTDELANSSVAFGPTVAYENGSVDDPALVTDHVILLSGLLPGTTYHYQVTSVDTGGNPVSSGDLSFTTVAVPSGILSDDFNHACSVLEDAWSFVDPRGDGAIDLVGSGTQDAQVLLSVPAGTSHDLWRYGNFAPRIMRAANDTDFEIEAKFESPLLVGYQGQGLVVEAGPSDFLRFDFFNDGSNVYIFAASITGGNAGNIHQSVITPGVPLYLRVRRQGDLWTESYSYDGVIWTTAASFTHPVSVTAIGPFVMNYPRSGSIPAHTAIVDYVFNTSFPMVPEDGTPSGDPGPKLLDLTIDGLGWVSRVPDQPVYDCGEVVELTATPAPGQQFDGWAGDATGMASPLSMVMSKDRSVTALFVPDITPPVLSDILLSATPYTAAVTWTTNELADSSVAYGPTAAYEYGSVDDPALVINHGIMLPGLDPETTYHYQVTSVDAVGVPASSGDLLFATPPAGVGPPLIDLWYGTDQSFGQLGLPQVWVNILGNVSDADGVASLTYSLNSGPVKPLNMGPDVYRLAEPGDFNIDIPTADLLDGINSLFITAVDSLDNTSVEIVTIDFASDNVWPLPYTVDWSTVSNIQDVAQVVDGLWAIESGLLRPLQLYYDRLVAIGDIAWGEYEVTVPITIYGFDPGGFNPPSNRPAVGLLLRWLGHTDAGNHQPERGIDPLGAAGLYRISEDGPPYGLSMWTNESPTTPSVIRTLDFGVRYIWKMRVEDIAGLGPLYSLKVWEDGEPEPPAWDLQEQQELTDLAVGSLVLLAHHVDAWFGTVSITPLGP
jgi:hypothetical protein